MAPIMAVAGGIGLLGISKTQWRGFPENVTTPIWAVLFLLIWALISSLWSPYKSGEILSNPVKLLIGVMLFLGVGLLTARTPIAKRRILSSFLIVIFVLACLVMVLDLISGYEITFLIDPIKDGEEFARRKADAIQNVGHGGSILAISLAPITLIAWQKGGLWRGMTIVFLCAVLVTTFISSVTANFLAALAACLFMAIGFKWPKFAIHMSLILAGIMVAAAPILAFIASRLTPDFKANLPFSWEERAENWSYLYDRIFEKPFFGHGFDAVRTFTETHTIRGFPDRAYVSLHPHNAGLHIWVELGFFGALIVYWALYLGAKHLSENARLSHAQMMASAGLIGATTVISALSYGVWQDWWWASVIFAAALIPWVARINTEV